MDSSTIETIEKFDDLKIQETPENENAIVETSSENAVVAVVDTKMKVVKKVSFNDIIVVFAYKLTYDERQFKRQAFQEVKKSRAALKKSNSQSKLFQRCESNFNSSISNISKQQSLKQNNAQNRFNVSNPARVDLNSSMSQIYAARHNIQRQPSYASNNYPTQQTIPRSRPMNQRLVHQYLQDQQRQSATSSFSSSNPNQRRQLGHFNPFASSAGYIPYAQQQYGRAYA